MDPLIGAFTLLLAASATTFFWLNWMDGRRRAASIQLPSPAVALDDLVGGSHPLTPRTIRQTSIE